MTYMPRPLRHFTYAYTSLIKCMVLPSIQEKNQVSLFLSSIEGSLLIVSVLYFNPSLTTRNLQSQQEEKKQANP